jgi:hypothetical protein
VRELLPRTTWSTQVPGTVVSADDAAVVVATANHDVEIRRLETLDGTPFPLGGLRAGARFELLSAARAEELGRINASLCAHEAFWTRRLETQVPLTLPGVVANDEPVSWQHADVAPPAGVADADGQLAAIVTGLARASGQEHVDLGFADPALRRAVGAAPAWFAQQVPLRVAPDATRDTVVAELGQLRRRVSYANDAVARWPALRRLAQRRNPRVLPVAVTIVDSLDEAAALPGQHLCIALKADGTRARWGFDAARVPPATMQAALNS